MHKAKKPTKKEIIAELRSLDCTRIHRIAAKCGIDANNPIKVSKFADMYVCERLQRKIFSIVNRRDEKRNYFKHSGKETTIQRIRREMMKQIKWKMAGYDKMLIEGNESIYWASTVHLHKDYNKSRAMPNTERNRKIMILVNTHLAKHGIK